MSTYLCCLNVFFKLGSFFHCPVEIPIFEAGHGFIGSTRSQREREREKVLEETGSFFIFDAKAVQLVTEYLLPRTGGPSNSVI